MKRRLQPSNPAPVEGTGSDHQAHQPRQIVSPYLTSTEAVVYLNLGSLNSLYAHIRENRLPVCRAGRHLRFDRRELDAWLRNAGSALELVRLKRNA